MRLLRIRTAYTCRLLGRVRNPSATRSHPLCESPQKLSPETRL
jgi:hypothetical protein